MNIQVLKPAYPRGSEWRKWDLQVHTPFSALNNGFGTDFPAYAQKLLTKAVEGKIAVVGITDYFTIDGYKALRVLLANKVETEKLIGAEIAEEVAKIMFVPNIELRTSIIVRDAKGADSRVNFHVFFADTVSSEDIEEHFLRELKFTAEANPNSSDERWSLTTKNLAELGKKLKTQHEHFRQHSDLYIGMMNAVVDHGQVSEILENKLSIFKDKYLLCLPCDEDLSKCSWNGQGHLTRKVLIQKSHLLLSSSDGTRAFALGKRHPKPEDFIIEFKSFKPCINSSDAHTFDELFSPDKARHTWVKADPTFQGLRQILNEPEDRIYIGEMPTSLARAAKRATRIAKLVEVKKLPAASTAEKWFDCVVPLNSELIAVIGNKGSGKSALSDILGLVGNTPRYSSFSFLRPDRFRSSKNNKAKQFQASLTWADDTIDSVPSLDCNPNPEAVEKVKYIPQNYLEEICNEIGLGKGSRFYDELQQVIFSHVPESEKLGFATLDELLSHRSEETNQAIEHFVRELQECNTAIVATEERLSPQHQKTLESQLAEKTRELEAQAQTRPQEVQKPEADPAAQLQSKAAAEALEKKQAELKAVETEISALKSTDANLAKKRSTAEKLSAKLKNLQRQIVTTLAEAKPDFDELNLTQEQVLTLTFNTAPIDNLITAIDTERATIATKLDGQIVGSSENSRATILVEIENLQAQLSAPQRAYQAYLQVLKEWELAKEKIVGTEQAVGSVKHLERQLADLKELPNTLKALKKQRNRKLLEVFREKQKLRTYYETYYGAVQQFLGQHPLATSERFQLTFNVSMAQSGFADAFLNRIHRRKIGPFMGEDEGGAELKRLLDYANFDSALGTLRFTRALFQKMSEHGGKQIEVKDQLKQGVTLQELYDFVFSLGFLSPIYNLRWDGKGLEQLSPGERGNLLLIFYLLVDQDDIPLVIDQPEENLDNQTVFKTLVPCIKDAKKRRQIVMVTHNPNLAVVCDAEQVICAEMQKDHENTVTYTSGSIENPNINKKIVDILEGTRPAFDKRDDKYIP